MYVHLRGAIDIENRFFLSVLESEKAPLRVVPVLVRSLKVRIVTELTKAPNFAQR